MRVSSCIRALMLLVAVLPVAARADFDADVAALTRDPHRLSGTAEGRAAADYIEERLLAAGIAPDQVFPLDMTVWQTRVARCELVVGDRSVPMLPLQPNLIVPPVTPRGGITAASIYVGDGSLAAYGVRRAEDAEGRGKVVVLNYDSFDHWQTAFSLGASAVVFIGEPDDPRQTPRHAKAVGVPANLPRFYVRAGDLRAAGIDLTSDHQSVTLHSEVVWEKGVGRNLVARVAGTAPMFGDPARREAVVLAVNYDSFGAVPRLSPGARGAANVAALLEAAERFAREPGKRDVLLMFVDNQARHHQGAREVYHAMTLSPSASDSRARGHEAEEAFLHRMRAALRRGPLATIGGGIADAAGPGGDAPPSADVLQLSDRLELTARHRRDDVGKSLQIERLRGRRHAEGSDEAEAAGRRIAALEREQMRWDDIRRALSRRELPLLIATQRAILAGDPAAPPEVLVDEAWASSFADELAAFRDADAEARSAAQARAGAYLDQLAGLRGAMDEVFTTRLAELAFLRHVDAQRAALLGGLRGGDIKKDGPWIALHAAYDFSGDAPTWGVVVGDWTDRMFARVRLPKPEANQPGFYGQTLQAFAAVVQGLDGLRMDTASLKDPTLAAQLCPRPFVTSGYVAGMHGYYHVALMTAHDARLRDGHPADTADRLDRRALREQAAEATGVLARLISSDELTRPQVFKAFTRNKYPTWTEGRTSGNYVGEQVTGSLSENRPAVGAMMAMWPGRHGNPQPLQAWDSFRDALELPNFVPIALEAVDANGRFRVLALEASVAEFTMTLGALFDERGGVRAISTRKQQAAAPVGLMRADLFAAEGSVAVTTQTYPLRPEQLKVLRAGADAEFRDTRSLIGQVEGVSFWYVSDFYAGEPVKVFQPMGPVALGIDPDDERNRSGVGLPASAFELPPRLSPVTARDLWGLNETRLSQLRSRGVTSADLEDLHGESRREREAAGGAGERSLAAEEAGLLRAGVLSMRVYAPLRQAMDDLVHAIVILLLLAIPFAFSLERLLVCAPTIYGRIAGFVTIFLVTFALLYFTHPGFAIASTPIIIFLAFTIILLSSLVIYIVVRKFRVELKGMQGHAVGLHDIEVSSTGTLLAAVNMGMSTMRRRPTRTGLTAVTVVALTFTILCFASFSRTIGVRSIPAGLKPETTAPGLLVRNLDYSAMQPGVLSMLEGLAGEGGLISPQWWLIRRSATDPPFGVTNPLAPRAGAAGVPYALPVDAVMGVSLEELERWYELAMVLGAPPMPDEVKADGARREAFAREHAEPLVRSLASGDVYLPPIVRDLLHLEPGQPILLAGERARFAGVIDTAQLQRLRHLDGESAIPVDFTAAGNEGQTADAQSGSGQELVLAEDVEKDFVHLSADQVAVVSADRARRMGGRLHLVSIYPGRGADGAEVHAEELGADLAKIVVMPVWAAGREGVQRMLLTVLTEVSGGLALGVPLVLGGLIIFGTLLGSIQDREKEIYTFSALGLSPTHVGVLFFAEAAVYAVVGGMGGQLLAQFVALAAGRLARAGYIDPANINYSSTNALFAIGVVMATVLVSAIYPALRASRSANPGLARAWKMPPPDEDDLRMKFPFTVSAYDITGVMSFLAEHFRRHDDAGIGTFASQHVGIRKNDRGHLELYADLALAPFDLGVTQRLTLTALPSEIEGVDEVAIHAHRASGAKSDWLRSNRTFLKDLRKQFLLWRTLSSEMIEKYRMETLTTLGSVPSPALEEG